MRSAARSCATAMCLAALGLLALGCSDSENPKPKDAGVDAVADQGPGPDGPTTDAAGDAAATRIEIPGLEGELAAVYDEHGLLHLTCKSDDDCFAALGYFHAANRFFFMDFVRRLMRGRLAELVKAGDLVLESDYAMRLLMTSRQGEPLELDALAKSDPETVRLFQRYADGINAWIADLAAGRNGAKLPVEYDFPLIASKTLAAWEPADSMAVSLYMMNDLGNTADTELKMAEVAAAVPPALAADLLNPRPAFQSFTLVEAEQTPVGYKPDPRLDLTRFAAARDVLRSARALVAQAERFFARGGGSNNWVVAPSRTTAKRALLANDPHLALLNPSIWMPVELDAKSKGQGTFHVAGGTVPGIPIVLIGRNEQLAWGVTTANFDLNEVYLEQLNATGDAVIFQGKEVPLLQKKLTFANAAGDPVERTFKWVPHHGPVIAEDAAKGQAVSLRWIPQEGLTDADGFYALMRTAKVADVPAALQKITAADQNFVVVDTAGNIGWFPYGKLPARPWASLALPPWLPVPGDGSAEWAGFLSTDKLPQATNPASGALFSANQAFTDGLADGNPFDDGTPAGELSFQALSKNPGARAQRIAELLAAKGDAHSVETMLEMQADVYSLAGELLAPELVSATAAATLSPEATKVATALQSWKHTCPTGLATTDPAGAKDGDATRVQESIGCTAFHAALSRLLRAAFGDEFAAAGVTPPLNAQLNLLVTAITAPAEVQSNFWDDVTTTDAVETKQQILLRAVIEAGAALAAWKPDAAEWQWGRLHTLTLRSIYDQFGVPAYNAGPYANDGALDTVDVGNPVGLGGEELKLHHSAGASLRMVVEASATGLTMKWQYPGGTSMYGDSPRYNQLVDRYLRNEPVDFAFGGVSAPQETLQVFPAQ